MKQRLGGAAQADQVVGLQRAALISQPLWVNLLPEIECYWLAAGKGEVLGRRQPEAHARTFKRPQTRIKTASTQTGIKTTYTQTHTNNPCPQGMHAKTAKSI